MVQEIHGHEVMQMMIASGKVYTKDSLEQDIIDTFGEDTRFYTCSVKNMNAGELVDFLKNKGKFLPFNDGFTTEQDRICDHDLPLPS